MVRDFSNFIYTIFVGSCWFSLRAWNRWVSLSFLGSNKTVEGSGSAFGWFRSLGWLCWRLYCGFSQCVAACDGLHCDKANGPHCDQTSRSSHRIDRHIVPEIIMEVEHGSVNDCSPVKKNWVLTSIFSDSECYLLSGPDVCLESRTGWPWNRLISCPPDLFPALQPC